MTVWEAGEGVGGELRWMLYSTGREEKWHEKTEVRRKKFQGEEGLFRWIVAVHRC